MLLPVWFYFLWTFFFLFCSRILLLYWKKFIAEQKSIKKVSPQRSSLVMVFVFLARLEKCKSCTWLYELVVLWIWARSVSAGVSVSDSPGISGHNKGFHLALSYSWALFRPSWQISFALCIDIIFPGACCSQFVFIIFPQAFAARY